MCRWQDYTTFAKKTEVLAVITGATKGIGKAIAEKLAAEGFNLILTARTGADLQLLKKSLEERFGIKTWIKAADFSRKPEVVLFAEFVKTTTNHIDILVNNTGKYQTGKLFEQPMDILEEQLKINFFGAHLLTANCMDMFRKQQEGHIFNICSIVNRNLRHEAAFYSISKQALLTWNKLLFEEMREIGVRVTAILPSSTYTDSWKTSGADPSKLIHPEDIAEALFECYKFRNATVVEEIIVRTMHKNME